MKEKKLVAVGKIRIRPNVDAARRVEVEFRAMARDWKRVPSKREIPDFVELYKRTGCFYGNRHSKEYGYSPSPGIGSTPNR